MDNRVNLIFKYLKNKNFIDKFYRVIYPSQYRDLNNELLLNNMGIKAHFSNKSITDDKSILVNEKSWRYASVNKKSQDETVLIIDEIDDDKLTAFKKNTVTSIFLRLINYSKAQLFGGILLNGIKYLSLFYICLYFANITELSFNLKDKAFFEYSSLVILLLILLNVIIAIFNDKNEKKNIDELKNHFSKNITNSRKFLLMNKGLFRNTVNLLSVIYVIILLYFLDIQSLKYGLSLIIPLIIISFIEISYLSRNGIKLKKLNKIITILFCISLTYSVFIFLSYRVMSDSIALNTFIIDFVLIALLLMPFIQLDIKLLDYIDYLIYLENNNLNSNDNEIDKKQLVLLETPAVVVSELSDKNGLFESINLIVDSNSIIEICGEALSGKTMLYKLLTNSKLRKSGTVTINDQELNSISTYNNLIMYVKENNEFGNKTFKEFLIGNDKISEGYLYNLIYELNITFLLDRMPSKLNTCIRVCDLSNSEIVLLNILRAILRDYRIYFFDQLLSQLNLEQLNTIMNWMSKSNSTYIVLEKNTLVHSKINNYYQINNNKLKEVV